MADPLKVLALDPGERVGWATGWIYTEGPSELRVENHGITQLKPMALKVHEVAGDYDLIIYETFRLRPASAKQLIGSDFPTVQFIGMVRLAAWLAGTKLVSQGPSIKATADKVIPVQYPDIDARIKALPASHDESHDGDALRHLAFYHFDRYVGKS